MNEKKTLFKNLAQNLGQSRGVIRKGLSLNQFNQKVVKFNTTLTPHKKRQQLNARNGSRVPQKKNANDSQVQIGYSGSRV